MRVRRIGLVAAAAFLAFGGFTTPPPVEAGAPSDEYQGRIDADPDDLRDPASACSNIPAVHHRMWGIKGERNGDGTENTLFGMQQTYNEGVVWFETDAQALLSREERLARRNGTYNGGHHGAIVLFHDGTLDRTTPHTGRIRDRTYSQLPLTNDGHRIPTLEMGLQWIAAHPETRILIEIKMKLPWRRVNDLLDKYGLARSPRVIFDVNKADGFKHDLALKAAENLNAITGVKTWPIDRPATWLRQYGTAVRLTYAQAVAGREELQAAGIRHIFSKIANGTETQTAQAQWSALARSGAFDYIITERTNDYHQWCVNQLWNAVDGDLRDPGDGTEPPTLP